MRSHWHLMLIALFCLVLVVITAYWTASRQSLKNLEQHAKSDPVQGHEAIERLSRRKKPAARMALLRVVEESHLPENQLQAVQALAADPDPIVSQKLAETLQPYQSLKFRHAVVSLLGNEPCDTRCAESILDYLERRSLGVRTIEETLGPIELLQAENTALEVQLLQILSANRNSTAEALRHRYGLGWTPTSLFPIEIVEKLSLRESCGLVRDSASLVNERVEAEEIPAKIRLVNQSLCR